MERGAGVGICVGVGVGVGVDVCCNCSWPRAKFVRHERCHGARVLFPFVSHGLGAGRAEGGGGIEQREKINCRLEEYPEMEREGEGERGGRKISWEINNNNERAFRIESHTSLTK